MSLTDPSLRKSLREREDEKKKQDVIGSWENENMSEQEKQHTFLLPNTKKFNELTFA